jgi:hypothetical protein
MLDSREELDWVKHSIGEILRDIPRQLPNTFQDQFCDLCFLGFR